MAESRLELVCRIAHRRSLLRSKLRSGTPPLLWLASQLDPVLGLPDRPAPPHGVAGEAAAHIVAIGGKQGAAVALAELARLEQRQGLVGEIEQADQVGDGG